MPKLTRSFLRSSLVLFGLVALLVACSSEADIGETCDAADEGKSTDVCVSGAVCARDRNDATYCLKTCNEDKECSSGQTCSGTKGSLKACRS